MVLVLSSATASHLHIVHTVYRELKTKEKTNVYKEMGENRSGSALLVAGLCLWFQLFILQPVHFVISSHVFVCSQVKERESVYTG